MSKAKNLSLSVIFQFINIVVTGIVGIVIVPIIIDFIGQNYYGILELILSLMIINFFFELGMGNTLLRFIPVYKKEGIIILNKFLWTYLYFKSFLVIIAFIIVIIIGFYFDSIFNVGDSNYILIQKSVFLFAIGIIISNFSGFIANILKGLQRFDLAIIPQLISNLVFLIVIYLLKKSGTDFVSIIHISFLMFILRPLIQLLFSIIFLKKTAPFINLIPVKLEIRFLKESFKYLKGMSLITLFAQLYNQAPKIIMGIMLNPTSVAYWGISERLRQPLKQINSSLITPLIPMASSMDLTNYKNISFLIIKITKVHFLVIGGIASFIFIFVNSFIKIWLSEEYLYVGEIIRIMLIPFLLPNASGLLMFYYAKGKTRLSQYTSFINSFVGLLLGSLLINKYDAAGFAVGLVFTAILTSIIGFYYLCKEFQISFYSIFSKAYLGLMLILGLIMVLNYSLTKYIEIDSWAKLIFTIVIGLIVYLSLVLFTLNREEKGYYKNLLYSVLKIK